MINRSSEHPHFSGAIYRVVDTDENLTTELVPRLVHYRVPVAIENHPSGWQFLRLSSNRPLLDESGPGPFVYSYLFRESGNRFILFSLSDLGNQIVIDRARLSNLVEEPQIDINKLVRHNVWPPNIEAEPQGRKFILNAVWAAISGEGKGLRTVSFFGDNLAEGKIFKDNLEFAGPEVLPYRVSLREISAKHELASIGSKGELSIYLRGQII